MSALTEIEAAVEQLPVAEQRALFDFIVQCINRSQELVDDPVTAVIGAYSSGVPNNDIAERDEDVLYGYNEAK